MVPEKGALTETSILSYDMLSNQHAIPIHFQSAQTHSLNTGNLGILLDVIANLVSKRPQSSLGKGFSHLRYFYGLGSWVMR
jgi:hypothetical protein